MDYQIQAQHSVVFRLHGARRLMCETAQTEHKTVDIVTLISTIIQRYRRKKWNGFRKTGFGWCSLWPSSQCIYSATVGMVDTVAMVARPTTLATLKNLLAQTTHEMFRNHRVTNTDRPSRGQNGGIEMLNIKVVTWSLAIWTTFTFLFCVAFAMLTPQSLYMHALLLQVLPGFEWFSWRGFLVGLIESHDARPDSELRVRTLCLHVLLPCGIRHSCGGDGKAEVSLSQRVRCCHGCRLFVLG